MNLGLNFIQIFHNYDYNGFPGNSDGKEFTCNAGDPGLIPGSGSSPGEEVGYPLPYSGDSLVAQTVKNSPAIRSDLGLIPGLGRSPGERNGNNPLQYSCLGNPRDRGA